MSIYRISFHVTDRCQLNCDHCLRDPGKKPLDLPLSILESAVDQARALYGVPHVGLTGGEPTLHPQFYEMVDAIVDRGGTWSPTASASIASCCDSRSGRSAFHA